VSGDEVADASGGGTVDVNGGESGGEHGWENGDGHCAFSCSIDYDGVWQSVDTPAHLLTSSDRIPIHLPHLGEHTQSLVPRRVSPQE